MVDPYELEDPDALRADDSEVVRFWHRLAVVDEARQADRRPLCAPLSRELGGWFALGFRAVRVRRTWRTGPIIRALAVRLAGRGGRPPLGAGFIDEASRLPDTGRFPYDAPEPCWRSRRTKA